MPESSNSYIGSTGMTVLSRLLLSPYQDQTTVPPALSKTDFDHLRTLADLNHVIVRGLEAFATIMRQSGDQVCGEWASQALAAERQRILHAISFLHAICAALEEEGHSALVIKSLDHWPDLGSDLDLYTGSQPRPVCALMQKRFRAQIAPRSWGDRLAGKWNFLIPGLPEAVEIHMGRLGQTGEQVTIASWLTRRAQTIQIAGHAFKVPATSDRLLIATLQRMYRHFYFRLCDVVDTAALAARGAIDYGDLRSSALSAGIWQGTATYLKVVSDYAQQFGAPPLDVPRWVTAASRFGGEVVYFRRDFLRVPILPQSAGLYGSQLAGLLRKCELTSGARLGLLPWLATAALVGQKITGTDKGIW